MILICHLLVGAAIASKIQLVPLVLSLAFLSHYFLDSLPQYEYSIKNIKGARWHKSFGDFFKVFLDISFGLLLILLFSEASILIFAAAFLAILSDGFTLLTVIFHKNRLLKKHQELHLKINHLGENKKIPVWGKVLCQILIGLIAIFFLL